MDNEKIEKAKVFIGELDALMKKHGMEEMIVIAIVGKSMLPIFIQDDPDKKSSNREFLQKIYASLVSLFSHGAEGLEMHSKESEKGWGKEKMI